MGMQILVSDVKMNIPSNGRELIQLNYLKNEGLGIQKQKA